MSPMMYDSILLAMKLIVSFGTFSHCRAAGGIQGHGEGKFLHFGGP